MCRTCDAFKLFREVSLSNAAFARTHPKKIAPTSGSKVIFRLSGFVARVHTHQNEGKDPAGKESHRATRVGVVNKTVQTNVMVVCLYRATVSGTRKRVSGHL
jgi:hypothetical protein